MDCNTQPRIVLNFEITEKMDFSEANKTLSFVIDEGKRLFDMTRGEYDQDTKDRATAGLRLMESYSNQLQALMPIPPWTPERAALYKDAREKYHRGPPLGLFPDREAKANFLQRMPVQVAEKIREIWRRFEIMQTTPVERWNRRLYCGDPDPEYYLQYLVMGQLSETRLAGESVTHCVARELLNPTAIVFGNRINCVPFHFGEKRDSGSIKKVCDELVALGYKGIRYCEGMGFKVDYRVLCGEAE